MFTIIIMFIVLAVLFAVVFKMGADDGIFLSCLVTFIATLVLLFSTEGEPDTFQTKTTKLYSIKNFENTRGIWYIGTDSDYISYVGKNGGYTKFRMPESSIIMEDESLTDTGYFEEEICIPGTGPSFDWIFIPSLNRFCDTENSRKERYSDKVIRVPKNTVTLNFKI